MHNTWKKHSASRLKCNIDASFSTTFNKVWIDICIRDQEGQFVVAQTEWVSPITEVDTR